MPLFEDKVVDFLAELIQVDDKKVNREILFLDPDEAEERLKAVEGTPAAAEAGEAKPEKKAKAKAEDKDEGHSEAKPRSGNKPKAKKKKEE